METPVLLRLIVQYADLKQKVNSKKGILACLSL